MNFRIFSICISTFAGVLLLTPFLVLLILVKMTSPGPAIHWSKRVGRNNKIFLMPKFRTMRLDTPQVPTHLLLNEKNYLTPIGSFLRKTSLDEIPQVWSVLRGNMNIVGPRPALFNQDDLVALRTKYNIHTLTPGITGWAQVNGRDELSIEDKVKFDREYFQHKSFLLDMKIILLTVYKVFLGKDIWH